MRDGKNWIVSLCLNCDVQHIYIYILLLIDDWKIEKLELKIGVFDQNESEEEICRTRKWDLEVVRKLYRKAVEKRKNDTKYEDVSLVLLK